jgi:hypothetical protein
MAIGKHSPSSVGYGSPALPAASAPTIREQPVIRFVGFWGETEERKMPVILLWAIPTMIVIGGASYYLLRVQ